MSVKYILGHKYFWVRIVPGLCVALMHPPTPRLLHWRLFFSQSGHASFESRCTFARSQCHTFCGCFKYFLFQLFQIIAKYAENTNTNKEGLDIAFASCPILHRVAQTRTNTGQHDHFQGDFFACFEQLKQMKKTIIWTEL